MIQKYQLSLDLGIGVGIGVGVVTSFVSGEKLSGEPQDGRVRKKGPFSVCSCFRSSDSAPDFVRVSEATKDVR